MYAHVNLSGAVSLAPIPLAESGNITRVLYSRDSQKVVFIGGNLLQIYTPGTGKIATHAVSVPSSFVLVSPTGEYVSWYSYTSEAHMVADLANGEIASVPSEAPGYFEIAENGQWGIFKDIRGDGELLRLAVQQQDVAGTDTEGA